MPPSPPPPAQPMPARAGCPAPRLGWLALLLGLLTAPAWAALKPGQPAAPFSLTDHQGRPLTMAALRGRVAVLTFFYRTCPEATMCPRLVERLQQAQGRIAAGAGGDRVRIVAVTLDPARDTVAALGEYARRLKLPSPTWRLLTGPPEEIQALARAYGVVSFPQRDGSLGHNMGTALIGADGRFRKLFPGSGWSPDALAAEALRLAGEGRPR